MRRIEFQWNKNGPLEYISPAGIISWVEQSGYTTYLENAIEELNKNLQARYKWGSVFDKYKFVEYVHDGIEVRLDEGVDYHAGDLYFEIRYKDELVMLARLDSYSAYISRHQAQVFAIYCMIYTSSMLADSILFDDSTDSISTCVNDILEEEFTMTKVFNEEYKGHKMFSVWEVDENGNKKGKSPVISFGARKAKAIANHTNELTEWVKNTPGNSGKMDMTKLSQEERDQLTALLGKMK